MKAVNHPNIVKLLQDIETKRKYLVLEHPSGHLSKYLEGNKILSENDARTKIQQLISAFQYLHQNKIFR